MQKYNIKNTDSLCMCDCRSALTKKKWIRMSKRETTPKKSKQFYWSGHNKFYENRRYFRPPVERAKDSGIIVIFDETGLSFSLKRKTFCFVSEHSSTIIDWTLNNYTHKLLFLLTLNHLLRTTMEKSKKVETIFSKNKCNKYQ